MPSSSVAIFWPELVLAPRPAPLSPACSFNCLMFTQEDQRAGYAAKACASWLSHEALSTREFPAKAQPEGRKEQHVQSQDGDDDTSVRALARRERQRLAGESAIATFVSKTPDRARVASPWGWRTTPLEAPPAESRTPKTPTVVILMDEDDTVTRANSRQRVRGAGVGGNMEAAAGRGRGVRAGSREGQAQHCSEAPGLARWMSPFEIRSRDAKMQKITQPPLSSDELQQCLQTRATATPVLMSAFSQLQQCVQSVTAAEATALHASLREEEEEAEEEEEEESLNTLPQLEQCEQSVTVAPTLPSLSPPNSPRPKSPSLSPWLSDKDKVRGGFG